MASMMLGSQGLIGEANGRTTMGLACNLVGINHARRSQVLRYLYSCYLVGLNHEPSYVDACDLEATLDLVEK